MKSSIQPRRGEIILGCEHYGPGVLRLFWMQYDDPILVEFNSTRVDVHLFAMCSVCFERGDHEAMRRARPVRWNTDEDVIEAPNRLGDGLQNQTAADNVPYLAHARDRALGIENAFSPARMVDYLRESPGAGQYNPSTFVVPEPNSEFGSGLTYTAGPVIPAYSPARHVPYSESRYPSPAFKKRRAQR
jgi:hypothetical protein